jgi:hypothetical protein
MASPTELKDEESIGGIIYETNKVVNQFMEVLACEGKLKDAVLNSHPIALQGLAQMIAPSVIGHIICNDHPLVHLFPSHLRDPSAQRVTND